MASFSWNTGTSGVWNTNTNWTPATVPNDAAADVTIDAAPVPVGGAYTVTLAALTTDTVNSLTMNGSTNLTGSNINPYNAAELELDGTLAFSGTSTGSLGGSLQTFVHTAFGSNAEIINPGTINGFIQVEGSLLLTGTNGVYITNDIQALSGTVTIDAPIAELTGSTLFDGIFEAKGPGAVVKLGGASPGTVVNIGTIEGPPLNPGGWTELTFNDPSAVIEEWNGTGYVSVETTLTDIKNAGTVDVLAGRSFSTGTNTLTVEAATGSIVAGMLNLQAGTVTTGGLDIAGIVQGSATIAGGVVNNGTLMAVGGTMDLTGSLTGTGVVKFDFDTQMGTLNATGATLVVNSVSAGQTVTMNSNDTLDINTLSSFAGTIVAGTGGVLGGVTASKATETAGTITFASGTQTVLSLALAAADAADHVTMSGSFVAVSTPNSVAPTTGSGIVLGNNVQAGVASTGRIVTIGTNVVAGITNGGGNTITAGAGDFVYLSGTGGTSDQVTASNVQSGVSHTDGLGSGIDLASGAETGVTGNNDFVMLGTNDVLGMIGGGGNTITAGAGDFVYVAGTGGTADQITATGDQSGYSHSDGLGSGIDVAATAEVGVTGSNDFVMLGTNDVLGMIGGGGNTITAGAGDFVYISGTGGTSDQVTATGDQAGFVHTDGLGSGIDVAATAEVGVTGSNDFVTLGTNDVLGMIGGGGNTIAAGVGDFVYVSGTNNVNDQINASNDQIGVSHSDGLGSGIDLGNNAQVGVTGSNNYIATGTNDLLGVIGGGGNTIIAGAGAFVYLSGTGNTNDAVNIAANSDLDLGDSGSIGFITGATGDVGVLASAGSQTAYTFKTSDGDQVDLRQILNGVSLAPDLSNLSNYVSVTNFGSNTNLTITGPSASDNVVLSGVGALSLQMLINDNAFALPPH